MRSIGVWSVKYSGNLFYGDRRGEFDIGKTHVKGWIIAGIVGIDDIGKRVADIEAVTCKIVDVFPVLRRHEFFIVLFPIAERIVIEDAQSRFAVTHRLRG